MPSIELRFDSEADAAIRRDWELLRSAGLPSQSDHTSASNAPHVTALFCTGEVEPFEVEPPGAPLAVGSPLVFPRKRGVVLARQVVMTRELLEWHERLHAGLPDSLDIDPHTLPGAWTPHVTLARVLPVADLPAALDALSPLADLSAPVADVRMWNGRTRTLTRLSGGIESLAF